MKNSNLQRMLPQVADIPGDDREVSEQTKGECCENDDGKISFTDVGSISLSPVCLR